MSDKYLIEKSTLTALGDIVRDYNETNDTYSLADITSQLKENSDNFKAMFNGTIGTIKSNTATSIGRGRFNDISTSSLPVSVNLPNVKTIGDASFQYNYFQDVNMPTLETIGENCFNYSHFDGKSVVLQNLKTIGKYSFTGSGFKALYLPNIETIKRNAFEVASIFNFVLKKLPTLESPPEGWGNLMFTVPAGYFVENEIDTNWGEMIDAGMIFEATTYEAEYDFVWKDFIEDGVLTEQEIRRDFYGEG